jgi:hypothetical protein
MRVRRVKMDVRWATRLSVQEERRLCDQCVIKDGKNCPRNKLPEGYPNMTAVICIYFHSTENT